MKKVLHLQATRYVAIAVTLPAAIALFASPALANTVFVEPVNTSSQPFRLPTASRFPAPNSDILCSYVPDANTPNSFGQNAVITLVELQGNSTFRYERAMPSGTRLGVSPDATFTRTITFNNTSANQAGQRLIQRPGEYANLLGVAANDPVVSGGFGAIATQFDCALFNEAIASTVSQFSIGTLNSTPLNIAALPDGNYRVTSSIGGASAGSASMEDSDLNSSGTQFLFRKLGDTITGNFEDFNEDLQACMTGTVQGNTIVGKVSTDSRITSVLGQSYLGSGLNLQVGETTGFNRYTNATLDLNGFTRVNAGSTTPPVICS